MRDAVIVEAVRTPVGKRNGGLSGVHPADLSAHVLDSLVRRAGLDPAHVDDVIWGCVSQVGEQTFDIARTAVLAAGWPDSVTGVTVDRQCGSSQQSVHFAAAGLVAGQYDVVVAGGVESMSRVPMGTSVAGMNPYGRRMAARYPAGLVNQGVSAELIAAKWKLDRETLDEYAATSHQRAAATWASGGFDREVLPVSVTAADGSTTRVTTDETVRASTTAEGLAGLRPSFRDEAIGERFPEIDWSITPGNSSPLTDGGSAALIVSEDALRRYGLTPRARFHAFSVVGDDPLFMLTGPIPATHKVLAKAGLSIDDIDAYEVNEAFAPVPLAWAREFGADPARLNPRGGAIALGHALGASGTRLLTTLVNHLEATGGRYGLQTMCEGGGLANATIIERL
jgi:acetyl-CoA acyltransferase